MPCLLRRSILILTLGTLAPALAAAQQRPPADTASTQPAVEIAAQSGQLQQMMPMMLEMMKQVTQGSIEALAEPATARNLARFTRNYYEALVEQGFSEAQAMQIVANLGFPPAPSM